MPQAPYDRRERVAELVPARERAAMYTISHAELTAGLQELAFADGELFLASCGTRDDGFELSSRGRAVERLGRHRTVGEDRHNVVGDLDETAVDIEPFRVATGTNAEFAVAQATDQRGATRGNAGFAIEERKGNEIGLCIECGRLRSDDDALEAAGSCGLVVGHWGNAGFVGWAEVARSAARRG